MEGSPLTLAHTHARNAVLETKRSNPVAASEEHDLAATEFAAAAQSTTDSEAIRILRLLEQHHKQLGNILKFRHEGPVSEEPSTEGNASTQDSPRPKPNALPAEGSTQPPRLVRPSRHPARDLSSSIASNLASARGIPSHKQKRSIPISPLVSSQHADGFIGQDENEKHSASQPTAGQKPEISRQNSARPSWAPPLDMNPDKVDNNKDNLPFDSTASDAPFQQFYSTFESLLSKLSAPLAFAGIPLTSTPPTSQSTQPVQASKPSPSARQRATEALQSSIDYSQLISRAALRAVRNDDPHSSHNPSESFYVVPTSGGTTSYADIMNRAEREGARAFRDHRRNFSNASNDDFVDASSTILSPPVISGGRGNTEPKVDGKTMEELALENKALKHLSDTLSKRLHVFEMSAQTSSAALAQSIRSLHLSPMTTPENSRGKAKTSSAFTPEHIQGATAAIETVRLNSRISELEEILRKSDARVKKREEENAKLRDMLVKYRDKWEGLKAGAKARREKQVQSGDSPRRKDKTRSADDGSSTGVQEKPDQKEDDQDLSAI